MKKLAAIYERKGVLFVSASHQTQAGFWVDDEMVTVLTEPTLEEFGQAIVTALERSKNGVPTPPPTARLEKPLLKAANVSSWTTFMNLSKHVSVSSEDGSLKITPYLYLGRKGGFEPRPDAVHQPSLSASELGKLVSEMIVDEG